MRKLLIRPHLLVTVLSLLLILGGSLSLTLAMRSRESNLVVTPPASVTTQKATVPVTTKNDYITGNPVRIAIASLNIDLPVIPGYYNATAQTWTLTTDKVQFATITPTPNNQQGNTFLYGHYRKNVFSSLHLLQADATAVITTENGHAFTYQLTAVHVVSPSDSASIFNYQGAPILTIQTCTGLFFENRQLFIFNLIRAV